MCLGEGEITDGSDRGDMTFESGATLALISKQVGDRSGSRLPYHLGLDARLPPLLVTFGGKMLAKLMAWLKIHPAKIPLHNGINQWSESEDSSRQRDERISFTFNSDPNSANPGQAAFLNSPVGQA